MASLAGYNTVVKKSGSTTAMTDEAMTGSGAGPYQIDTAAKRIWDRALGIVGGLQTIGTILISGVAAEKYKTTTTAYFLIGGTQYSKAATDNLTFGTAYTINTGTAGGVLYGVFLIQINAAGTVTGKAPSADQVYASYALALAALPSPDTGNVALGSIVIGANTGAAWTADTDDMTPASDCDSAVFADAAVTAISFEDNGAMIDVADISALDYLTGKVTFTGAQGGPVTVSGKYMPMAVVAQAHATAINLGGDLLDDTDFASAQSDPYVNRVAGLRDASVSITRWDDAAGAFGAILATGAAIVLEIQPGGSGKYLRGWFLLESENQSGDVAALEQDELTFQLDADDDALKSVSFDT